MAPNCTKRLICSIFLFFAAPTPEFFAAFTPSVGKSIYVAINSLFQVSHFSAKYFTDPSILSPGELQEHFFYIFFFHLFLEFYLRNEHSGFCIEYSDGEFRLGINCASFILYQKHFMHSSKQCLRMIPNEIVTLWECTDANAKEMENAGIHVLLKEKYMNLNGKFNLVRATSDEGYDLKKVYNYFSKFGMKTQNTGKNLFTLEDCKTSSG